MKLYNISNNIKLQIDYQKLLDNYSVNDERTVIYKNEKYQKRLKYATEEENKRHFQFLQSNYFVDKGTYYESSKKIFFQSLISTIFDNIHFTANTFFPEKTKDVKNLYVAEFPTKNINASIKKTDNGYLILINSGLINFGDKMLRHIIWMLDKTTEEISNYISENIEALSNLSVKYIYSNNISDIDQIALPLNRKKINQYQLIFRNYLKFIIAHEYSHFIENHLNHKNVLTLNTPVGKLETILKNWKMEFEADLIASEIVMYSGLLNVAIFKSNPKSGFIKEFIESYKTKSRDIQLTNEKELSNYAIGILLFIEIEKHLLSVSQSINNLEPQKKYSETHPPIIDRGEMILQHLKKHNYLRNKEHFDIFNKFRFIMNTITESVLKRIN